MRERNECALFLAVGFWFSFLPDLLSSMEAAFDGTGLGRKGGNEREREVTSASNSGPLRSEFSEDHTIP